MAKEAYIGIQIIQNPSPFSTTEGWLSNQNTTVSINNEALKVVSNQATSTPGVYTNLLRTVPASKLTLICKMRGNVKVSASLWNTSTGSISSARYDLTEEFRPCALIPFTTPGEVDRLYFFMESPTASSWFEISELELSYGPRKIKEIFIGVDDGIRLPDGYTRLEYIESTGTQYIDTELPWLNHRILLSGEFSYTDMKGHSSIFGTQGEGGNMILREESGVLTWYGTDQGMSIGPVPLNQKIGFQMFIQANGNATYIVSLEGNEAYAEIAIPNTVKNDTNGRIFVFDTHYTVTNGRGSAAASTIECHAKLYFLRIQFTGSEESRYLIPAKDSNGTIGLYDIDHGNFYINKGSGQFIAGPVRGNGVARKVNLAYIGVNGVANEFWNTTE